MKKNSEQAKFFCESCGHEVKQNAKVCNYCGKFFSSVRCPKCGKTGTTSEFENGCPDCGYAVGKSFNNIKMSNSVSFNGNKRNKKNLISFFTNKNSSKVQNSDSLPIWMYLVCIITLIVILILFYGCLK